MARYVVNTLRSDHYVRAHTLLFKSEIEKIMRKLSKVAREVNGVFYEPMFKIENRTVVGEGKIEFSTRSGEVVEVIRKVFNIASEIKIFSEESKHPDIVLVGSESGIMLTFRVSTDVSAFKMRYTMFLPFLIGPGVRAEKDSITVVYKLVQSSSRKVMRVGNTLTVPLKKELVALGNPSEVDVYLNREEKEIIIKPKTYSSRK